jgi:hypothetical protein
MIDEMRSDSVLSKAHRVFAESWAMIDTGLRQRTKLTPVEVREMEFDAVIKIAALLGVELKPGDYPKADQPE